MKDGVKNLIKLDLILSIPALLDDLSFAATIFTSSSYITTLLYRALDVEWKAFISAISVVSAIPPKVLIK